MRQNLVIFLPLPTFLTPTFLFTELLYLMDMTQYKHDVERDLGIFLKRLLTEKEIEDVFMLT
jgi:hypothetical protein